MCGIAGIVNLNSPLRSDDLRTLVRRMAEAMEYRGPDDSGVWVDPGGRVAFSHRRLSIIDTSPAGHQPKSSIDGRATITFNGEIYNFKDLKTELEREGKRFETRTDTEVLLEWIRSKGVSGLKEIDGMFAFGLFNGADGSLTLARDPFGEKPLYYTFQNGLFAFASELHCLSLLPNFDAQIDPNAIAELLTFQYVHAPRSIYQSVKKLPPGTSLVLRADGTHEISSFYHFVPKGTGFEDRSIQDLGDELESLLKESLERRLMSDVPLGAFLSGGVDSSLVVALMGKMFNGQVNTFSIGFEGDPHSEHHCAREMAQHLGSCHHERILSPDVIRLAEVIGRVLDEPNGDSSCLPTYLISEFARERVTVSLSGDGGDELFGGYGRYFSILEERAEHEKRGTLHAYSPGAKYFSENLVIFNEDQLESILSAVPLEYQARMRELRAALDAPDRDVLANMRAIDVATYLPGAVLPKVDRMSMQHSLEVRTPFLSIPVARFSEKLTRAQCYNAGQGKIVLKEVARRYIPMDWLTRPKRGFGIPMGRWAREHLIAHMRSLMSDQSSILFQFFDRDGLTRYFQQQERSTSPAIYQLWSLLVLELWFRSHRVDIPSVGTHQFKKMDSFYRRNSREGQQASTQDLQGYLDRHVGSAIRYNRDRFLPADMELQGYLAKWSPRSVIAFSSDSVPESLPHEPQLRVLVSSVPRPPQCPEVKFLAAAWEQREFWDRPDLPRILDGAQCAVFTERISKVPSRIVIKLFDAGVREIVWRGAEGWRVSGKGYRLIARSLRALGNEYLSSAIERSRRVLSAFAAKARRAAARRVLWYFGKRLPQANGVVTCSQDEGFSYCVHLPHLERFGDTVGNDRSRLLLFEHEKLLIPHSPHVKIRTLGRGYYAHWEQVVLFSSSDNWTPLTSKRDYRYLHYPRLSKVLDRLGMPLERLFDQVPVPLQEMGNGEVSDVSLFDSDRSVVLPSRPLTLASVSFREFAEKRARARELSSAGTKPSGVMLFVGSLSPGGAERQLCYLASDLKRRGESVFVGTYFHDAVNEMHYLPLLQRAGVVHKYVSSPHPRYAANRPLGDSERRAAKFIAGLPKEFASEVWALYTHLMVERPAVLHCWLDHPNVIGGIAGVLANVPRIVISGRNVNPTHFPYIFKPWYRAWYQRIAACSGVEIINNSMVGARSYADWLGLSHSRVNVVHNGIDPQSLQRRGSLSASSIRAELGLKEDTPLVVGVFRLSEEKRPLLFVDVFNDVRKRLPQAQAVIVGVGPLDNAVEARIREYQIESSIRLLGRRTDVHDIMDAANVVLLCSAQEGIPNVLMEAQLLGKPVVATAVGGVPDVVRDNLTGYLAPSGDKQKLVEGVVRLLNDPKVAMKMGDEGKSRILSEFSIENMVGRTTALYGPAHEWANNAVERVAEVPYTQVVNQ